MDVRLIQNNKRSWIRRLADKPDVLLGKQAPRRVVRRRQKRDFWPFLLQQGHIPIHLEREILSHGGIDWTSTLAARVDPVQRETKFVHEHSFVGPGKRPNNH